MSGFGSLGSYPLGAPGAETSGAIPLELSSICAVATALLDGILPHLADTFAGSDGLHAWNSPGITEALVVGSVFDPKVMDNLIGQLALATSLQDAFTTNPNLAAGAGLSDATLAGWRMLVESGVDVADGSEGIAIRVAALAEALAATGQVIGNRTAYVALAQAFALESYVVRGFTPDLVDASTLASATAVVGRMLSDAADSLLANDAGAPMLRISAIAAETVAFDGASAALLSANENLADGVLLYVTLRLGDSDYVGWVLNTATKAPSQYTNWAFDSFATFKGKDYAAGPNGLVQVTGSDDDGGAIAASLRTFLTDFGTSRLKRVPDVYIGAATDGTLVVKVLTRDPATGAHHEDWYTVARTNPGHGTGQAQIGRGLKSTWWAIELCNKAGASLDLDSIAFRPILLDRRV